MLEYVINPNTDFKVEQLQIGMTVGIGVLDLWNNEKLVVGTVSSVVTTDSGKVLKVALKNEIQMNVQEVEAIDIAHIMGATLRQANPQPPKELKKRIPNELTFYSDGQAHVVKVGIDNVTAIEIETTGMVVIKDAGGIREVMKLNEYWLMYADAD